MDARIALCFLLCTSFTVYGEVDIITEPRPGEEYVIVSSGQQSPLRNFESAHKIPEKHPQHRLVKPDDGSERIFKKTHSGKNKHPAEGIVAIEEDKRPVYKKAQKVKESIEIDIPVSKIEDIKIKENVRDIDINPKLAVLEAMSESGKLSNNAGTTTQKPVLTTSASSSTKGYDYIPINFDTIDDINSGLLSSNVKLETAGSEQKQHSRIQIKKGPNGQDYEYEYIYYYYDEEEESKKQGNEKQGNEKPLPSTEAVPVTIANSHDGPSKAEIENQISKETKARNRYSTIDRSPTTTTIAPTPEVQNEVIQTTGRTRSRGRNIVSTPVEEEVEAERLPSSTRFPPRGRNIAATSTTTTTSIPETTSEVLRQRGRPQVDNVADESIGQTRSRTRAHVRRPSSELVDLDSFKTNSGDIRAQYKEPPTRYSSESKTTTEVVEPLFTNAKEIQREASLPSGISFQEIVDDSKLPSDYKQTTTYEQETTEYTTMTAMEKVALDLYAYLAGENLNNEISPASDVSPMEGSTATEDDAWTTENISTTEEETTPITTTTTTSTTTTTTTTTTTPAPTTTTTTTTEPPTRPSRFKTRPGGRARPAVSTSAATEAPQETTTKIRGRFGKPSGARKITTAAAAAESSTAAAPAEKAPTQPKALVGGRRGLFAGRTRPVSSTAAPASEGSSVASEAPVTRPRLRPGLRNRGPSSTASPAPSSAEVADTTAPTGPAATGSGEVAETTVAPVRTIGGRKPGLRPASLRPGPKLNLRPAARLRPGAASVAPAETSEAPADASPPEAPAVAAEAEGETSAATAAPEQPRGGLKLRNRLQVSPSPKPRTTATAAPRRPNPLLKKRVTTEATTTEAPKKSTEVVEEEQSGSAEKSETEAETEAAVPVETTPAPPLRGLDALIARRRAAGVGARPVRPVRGTRS